jgi:hypothetical protein
VWSSTQFRGDGKAIVYARSQLRHIVHYKPNKSQESYCKSILLVQISIVDTHTYADPLKFVETLIIRYTWAATITRYQIPMAQAAGIIARLSPDAHRRGSNQGGTREVLPQLVHQDGACSRGHWCLSFHQNSSDFEASLPSLGSRAIKK